MKIFLIRISAVRCLIAQEVFWKKKSSPPEFIFLPTEQSAREESIPPDWDVVTSAA